MEKRVRQVAPVSSAAVPSDPVLIAPIPGFVPPLVLAAITIALFSPTLSAEFVYDAVLQIETGDFIHDPRNWLPVLSLGVLGMDVLDFNRPAQLASLMLDAAVWGRGAFGFHLTSVLLHAVNAVLVWGIAGQASRFSQVKSRAEDLRAAGLSRGLAALLFAAHPIVTEAVCEPTFREDLLVAACTLGALLVAVRHDPAAGGGDRGRALGCVGLCFLAVASKESGIAAPAVLAVYWWLFRRDEPLVFWRLAVGGGTAAAAAFLAARFLLEPKSSAIFEHGPQYPGGSFFAALALEPRILALYTQLVAFPVNLCADYGLYSMRHLSLPVALAIIACVVVAAVLAIRADRRMAVAVSLVVLPLVPVSNLVPIYRAAADRYLYLPMAGVALGVGWLLDGPWAAARPRLRKKLLIVATAGVAILGFACLQRQKVWTSSLALWEDTYRKNPVAYNPAIGLAEALQKSARLPEAERIAREAIRISKGRRGDPWLLLALIFDAQGREQEAFEAADTALDVQPNLANPQGRVRALAMEPRVAEAWGRLLQKKAAGHHN